MPAPVLKQPNLSARIGVKSLLGNAGALLKQPNLSTRIRAKTLLGGAGAVVDTTEPLSQDWGKIVVGRCWRDFQATKLFSRIRVK